MKNRTLFKQEYIDAAMRASNFAPAMRFMLPRAAVSVRAQYRIIIILRL